MKFLKFNLIFLFLFIAGCKPDNLEITLYTSDINEVIDNKLINLPVIITFSSLTEDKNNTFERASQVAKEFVPPETEFAISQGDYKKNLVVKTKLPFGKPEILKDYLTLNKRVAYVILEKVDDTTKLTFKPSESLKELNNKLTSISFLLGVDFPATRTTFKVVSDSTEPFSFTTYSTWVLKQAFMKFNTTLNKRDEVKVIFKGKDDSIWSQLNPMIFLN